MTQRRFRDAVEGYFRSISRTVPQMEEYQTGETDAKGKPITARRVVFGADDRPMMVTEYLVPPTVRGLCLHMGISMAQWQKLSDAQRHPALADTVQLARLRMEHWLEMELLTREKNLQGIIFHLQNNYDWKESSEVCIETGGTEQMSLSEKMALLGEIAARFAPQA